MASTGTDVSDLRKLTVVKLRAKLSELGLATGGLKADLVERLHKHYQQEAASGEDEEEEAEEGVDEEDGTPMEESGQFSPPPPKMLSPQRSAPSPKRPPSQRLAPSPQQPPPLMSINTQEPAAQRKQAPPAPAPTPASPAHITRTTLQMRLQQLAESTTEDPSAQQTPQTQPPGSQSQSQTPSPKATQQHTPEPKLGSPPPPRPSPPPPRPLLPPPPHMTPPPGIQHRPPIPPPLMTSPQGPPSGQPPPLGPMGQPPSMSQPPPPGQMSPSQPPPPGRLVPPPSLGKPHSLPPPPGVGPPPVPMGQVRPPPGIAPPQVSQSQQVPPPPGVGPPTSQMGQAPPPMMPPAQRNQDSEFREKVHMQTRLLEQERQQQQQEKQRQEKQRQLEQQQKERLAMQQQAMLLQQQQQQQSGPPAPPGEEGPGDLMEKVRQQQIMLEQQKRKEQLEQQQKAMLEQQNQAIKKQEEERKRKEVELVRQQIAIMEAQRDEQGKRLRDERRGPPPPVTTSSSGSQPFNPSPTMLQHTPRPPMMPSQPSGSRPPGIPPPHSAPGPMPPRMPSGGDRGDQIRGQKPPMEDRMQQEGKDFKLPLALAKTLAYRAVRALEVGTTLEEWERENMPQRKKEEEGDDEIEMVEMEEEDEADDEPQVVEMDTSKKSKSKAKKKKKKKSKKKRQQQTTEQPAPEKSTEPSVEIEYVPEALDLDPTDPNYFTFNKIFEAFKIEEPKEVPKVVDVVPEKPAAPVKVRNPDSDDDDSENEEDDKNEDKGPKMSKKKFKKMTRMSVAELKMQVRRPDLVEMHDVNAKDPILLLELKSTRNTVPVPAHWCFKRKYLQGKRGIEKAPFQLPEFIEATGITEMREAQAEKEDAKSLKGKMREKVRPKMGKIDIDYQKLHDAFFKYQVKPKLTIHGDLYYEGKEFETRLREKKPGNLSDDLKTALGMPIGPGSEKMPPPWLIAMQRYGPPPSYPNLKIPGLNAPIPEGCSFGYHAGGWGKPPVNESGKPLYGDVFGTNSGDFETADPEEEVDKSHWGEMESESEEEEEPESEEEEEAVDDTGLITPAEGLVTPSGITSIPVGMETPDMIELRKRRIEDAMDQGGETPALYQVIPEKKTTVGGAMMGSAHIYDVGALPGGPKKPGDKVAAEGIEVALNPEELDLDTAAMQAKYDQTLREQQSQLEKEDLSDMVAEHAAKQKKRKKKQEDSGKAAKKYKEFKF